jgi:hypothetical protein
MMEMSSGSRPMLTVAVCVFGMGASICREAEALFDSTEPHCTLLFLVDDHTLTKLGSIW